MAGGETRLRAHDGDILWDRRAVPRAEHFFGQRAKPWPLRRWLWRLLRWSQRRAWGLRLPAQLLMRLGKIPLCTSESPGRLCGLLGPRLSLRLHHTQPVGEALDETTERSTTVLLGRERQLERALPLAEPQLHFSRAPLPLQLLRRQSCQESLHLLLPVPCGCLVTRDTHVGSRRLQPPHARTCVLQLSTLRHERRRDGLELHAIECGVLCASWLGAPLLASAGACHLALEQLELGLQCRR